MATTRNSRIEALRIVAMIAIVGHHYAVHGGVMLISAAHDSARFLAAYSSFGKWGVDVFVLVAAYFMVTRKTRGKSLVSIYSQVLPMSWLILAYFAFFTTTSIGDNAIKKGLFPVIFNEYWFVTSFVVLVLIGPYLGIVADKLSKVQLQRLILVGVAGWSVLTFLDGVRLELSNLAWFSLLFMIAAYIRLHGVPGSSRIWGWSALGTAALLSGSVWFVSGWRLDVTGEAESLAWPTKVLASQQSLVSLAAAVAIVAWAVTARPTSSRVINYWAGAAFGVYLIHDNPLVRRVLWKEWADTQGAAGQSWLPWHALGWTLGVYILCSIVILILQPTVFKLVQLPLEAARKRITARLDRSATEPSKAEPPKAEPPAAEPA